MILSWKAPIDYNENLIGSYDVEQGSYETRGSNFNYLSLSAGERYPASMDKPSIFFNCPASKLSSLDCLWLLGGAPLISARLASFLQEQAAQELELIRPKAILAAGSDVAETFFVLNAITKASVVDQQRSDAERDEEGDIIYFNKIYFTDNEAQVPTVARDTLSHDLLISQTLADKIIIAGFKGNKGLGFYSVDRRFVPYKNQA